MKKLIITIILLGIHTSSFCAHAAGEETEVYAEGQPEQMTLTIEESVLYKKRILRIKKTTLENLIEKRKLPQDHSAKKALNAGSLEQIKIWIKHLTDEVSDALENLNL